MRRAFGCALHPPRLRSAEADFGAASVAVVVAEQGAIAVIADLQALLPAKVAGFAGAAVVVDAAAAVVAADEVVSVAAAPALAFVPLRDRYR